MEANGTNDEITKLQNAVTKNNDKAKNLQSVLNNLDTYPRLHRDAIDKITAACGTTVDIKDLTFDENYGTITITAQTPYVFETSDLITRLKKSGAFLSVYYSGYYEQTGSDTAASTQEDEKSDETDKKDSDEKSDEKQDEDTSAAASVKKNEAGFYEMSIVCVLKAGV